jgi:5-hydroxyisourate hydrolase-like protein (transthyretin family)
MPSRPSRRAPTLVGVLCALVLAGSADAARAGEFQVAACQADSLTFTTQAFADFATRGMKIKRACNPEGPGLRGLITANVVQRGRVRRGARAIVSITAPDGTRFTRFRWAGTIRRRDCRYALQLYATGPGIAPVPIKNVRANRRCPRRASHAQAAGYRSRTYDVTGATRIVQRVICVGGDGRQSCSARGSNLIRTYKATVGVVDGLAPSVAILQDTPLARGEWVSGSQPLNYTATDNVGVRLARAYIGTRQRGTHDRPCVLAAHDGTFADRVPCPNGPGQIALDTSEFAEGTQALVVQAQDAAGNVANSATLTARIDNTPPERADVGLDGGEGWRNQNAFAAGWTNPPAGDSAPITAAIYRLCPAGSQKCVTGEHTGLDISRFGLTVPAPGEWTLSVWRRDAAGNEASHDPSAPVTLRYDPEPPQLAFEPSPTSDPTLVGVRVTDRVSGLAHGAIELSRAGSGTWQALGTQTQGDRLLARIDDAALPAGTYELRARAADQAGNEGSTSHRVDGQPMVVTLPLRITSTMRAGVEHRKTVKRKVRRHGKVRRVRRRITVLRPAGRIELGKQVKIAGQLTNRDGQGIAGAVVQVYSSTETSPEQLVGTIQTDSEGRYRYTATGTSTRTLRLAYAGSPLVLPAQRVVRLLVPAASSLRVNRKRVLNGQSVRFTGRLRAVPVPAAGKLVELQVRLSERWQTFRTARSDQTGSWSIPYRFKRTRGVQQYRFRVRLPKEAGYPFEVGISKSLKVRVRGLR